MSSLINLYEDFKSESDHFKKSSILHKLSKELDIKLSEISKNINLSPSYISHIMRLKKLPDLIVDGYYSNLISITHLYIISRLAKHQEMIEVYEEVLTKNLTTIDTEYIVRQKLYGIKEEGSFMLDEEKKQISDKLKNLLGGEIKIIQSRIKSKLLLEIKGNLKETTEKLKKLMDFLNKP